MADDTYNGWTNRETWLANLWITNEQWTDTESRELVADYYDDPDNRRQGEITAAAGALEEWADDQFLTNPETGESIAVGFVLDLLNTSWGRINWREIAEGLLES